MKLFINIMIDREQVAIIIISLTSPNPPSSNDFGSLVPTRAVKISIVSKTATWAKIKFSF